MSRYFSKDEAQSKLGRNIRTKVDFSGVPAGTKGFVYNYYNHSGTKNYGVEIKWGLDQHLVDGFSKDEYDQFLEEL